MNRTTIIRKGGVLLIALGLVIHLGLIQKYLNFENDRRIKSIESKLDIIFEQNIDLSNAESISMIEAYNNLDSDTEKSKIVNGVANTLGFFYIIIGVVAILLGEYVRNYKKRDNER